MKAKHLISVSLLAWVSLALANPLVLLSGNPNTGGGGDPPGTYTEEVIADTPVGYWRLGESSGTTADDEIGANDMTYVNTPTLGVGGGAGDADTAITLSSASSEYAEVASDCGIDAYPFSFEILFKASDVSAAANMISMATSFNANQVHSLKMDATGKVGFTVRSGSGDLTSVYSASEYDDGAWHHAVLVANGLSSREVWVDGVMVLDDTATLGSNNVDNYGVVSVGRLGDLTPGGYFDGSLDEAAVYDRALTEAEIETHNDALP